MFALQSKNLFVLVGINLAGLAGLVLVAAPVSAVASAASQPPIAANITVVQTPAQPPLPSNAPCLPAALAARSSTSSDAATFRLRITLLSPLCSPIVASAVIYGMPGNGAAWPQQLKEKLTFTLQAAGVTEVTFTRTAEPVQFDVVTGATPQQIAPWLQSHGPLLFPFDTSTSQQSGLYGPPPVVPEVPLPLLLPMSAACVIFIVGAVMMSRRRQTDSPDAPSLNPLR